MLPLFEKAQLPHKIGYGSRVKMFFEPFAWQTGMGNAASASASGASRLLSWLRRPLRSPLLRVVGPPTFLPPVTKAWKPREGTH